MKIMQHEMDADLWSVSIQSAIRLGKLLGCHAFVERSSNDMCLGSSQSGFVVVLHVSQAINSKDRQT